MPDVGELMLASFPPYLTPSIGEDISVNNAWYGKRERKERERKKEKEEKKII